MYYQYTTNIENIICNIYSHMEKLMKRFIERVGEDKRLTTETRETIVDRLSNIRSINDYLGQIDMNWEVEPTRGSAIRDFNPTPLIVSIELNYVYITKALLEKGADYIKHEYDYEMTPLHFAIHHNNRVIVDIILSNAEKLGKERFLNYLNSDRNQSCIWHAVEGGHNSLVLKLYKKGARVLRSETPMINSIIEQVGDPRHQNSEDEQLILIKELIKLGADPYVQDTLNDNENALMVACRNGYNKIAVFLVEHGLDPRNTRYCDETLRQLFAKKWTTSRIESAVYDNDIENVKVLLPSNVDILNAINNAYLLDRHELITFFEGRPELYHLTTEKGNQSIWTIATSTGNVKLINRLKSLGKKSDAKKTISKFIKNTLRRTRKRTRSKRQ